MITTKQEKDKTTIVVSRRLRKAELDRAIRYLSFIEISPKTKTTKKNVRELAGEIDNAAWERFKKLRGIK